jgi:hypothetical protein
MTLLALELQSLGRPACIRNTDALPQLTLPDKGKV